MLKAELEAKLEQALALIEKQSEAIETLKTANPAQSAAVKPNRVVLDVAVKPKAKYLVLGLDAEGIACQAKWYNEDTVKAWLDLGLFTDRYAKEIRRLLWGSK